VLGHGLRHEARVRGPEERLADPGHGEQRGQDPHRRVGGERDRGEGRVGDRAPEVGGDHDPLPGQTVGQHTAEQDRRHERGRVRREHNAEVAGRAGELRHVERDRDEYQPVADRAHGLADPEHGELGVGEDARVPDPASGRGHAAAALVLR
jgi:hypothetical protein